MDQQSGKSARARRRHHAIMAHLKTARTAPKRAVTREINIIKQYVAEDDTVNVNDHVIKLKEQFKKDSRQPILSIMKPL